MHVPAKRFCIFKCVLLRWRPRSIADWTRLTSTAILQTVLGEPPLQVRSIDRHCALGPTSHHCRPD
eukprot:1428411-Lingulodinium_polyedra.AAC.1